jgi:RHS repeat-associated protein
VVKVAGNYRFGFNGKEMDDEIAGTGNSYTTHFRQYEARLGRWWSIDPKTFYGESPYMSMGNNPILYFDPLGDKIVFGKNEKFGFKAKVITYFTVGYIFSSHMRSMLKPLVFDDKHTHTVYSSDLQFAAPLTPSHLPRPLPTWDECMDFDEEGNLRTEIYTIFPTQAEIDEWEKADKNYKPGWQKPHVGDDSKILLDLSKEKRRVDKEGTGVIAGIAHELRHSFDIHFGFMTGKDDFFDEKKEPNAFDFWWRKSETRAVTSENSTAKELNRFKVFRKNLHRKNYRTLYIDENGEKKYGREEFNEFKKR